MFNTTFNKILVISWQSVLMLEETGVPGESFFLFQSFERQKVLDKNIFNLEICVNIEHNIFYNPISRLSKKKGFNLNS